MAGLVLHHSEPHRLRRDRAIWRPHPRHLRHHVHLRTGRSVELAAERTPAEPGRARDVSPRVRLGTGYPVSTLYVEWIMIGQALQDLWFGFGVALQPHNLWWSFFGVLVGNLIGVLPGMGALTAISMLLPLTYTLQPVPAILMLAGIFYGSQYGGAIGAILLNMPSHPPHAVTCLDGYPMTLKGKGGTALGLTMIASFFAASFGITVMVFASPLLVQMAFKFGPAEEFAIMLLGLLAGSTMSRGSPLKGVAMTTVGLLVGTARTEADIGAQRFTFGLTMTSDKVGIVALPLVVLGCAERVLTPDRFLYC